MLNVLSRAQLTRLAIGVTSALVLAAGALAGAPAAGAVAPAAGVAPTGGGWVAAPPSVHAAQLTLVVPRIRCAAKKSATLTVGLFGTTRTGSQSSPWQLDVVASCHHATSTYRAVAIDVTGRYTVLRLHVGDRVRLLESAALTYEVDNDTTGEGAGGGSASSGSEQPMLGTPVLFGARVTGSVGRALHVHVLRSRINRHPLAAVAHHRQRQVKRGHPVARATALGHDGSFTISIRRP